MGEETRADGISRRELLRRGAVLGGAVVWTTPVVQTLGMGRAFAQTASPEGGKDISYVVVQWSCDGGQNWNHTKWDNGWQAGATPSCEDELANSMAANIPDGFLLSVNGPCASITVPGTHTGCLVTLWLKAGSDSSNMGTNNPCQERPLAGMTAGSVYQTTVCTV